MSSEQQGASGARAAPPQPTYNDKQLLRRLSAADAGTQCAAVQELCQIVQQKDVPHLWLVALLDRVRAMLTIALHPVAQEGEPQPEPAHTPATEAAMKLLAHVPHKLLGMVGLSALALQLAVATARTHGRQEAQCAAIVRLLSDRAALPYDALDVVEAALKNRSAAGAAGHNLLLSMLCRALADVLSKLPATRQNEALVVQMGKLVQVIVDNWRHLVPCAAAGVDVAPAELAQFAQLRRVLGLNDEWANANSIVRDLIKAFAVGGVEDVAREKMAQAQQDCDDPSLTTRERTQRFLGRMLPFIQEFDANLDACAQAVPKLAQGVRRASKRMAGSSADEMKAASVAVGSTVGIFQGLGKAAARYFSPGGKDALEQLLLQGSLETEMRATLVSLAGEELKERFDKLQAQVDAGADGSSLVAMVVDFEEHGTLIGRCYMLIGDYLERMGAHVLLCAADSIAAAREVERILPSCMRVSRQSPITSVMREADLRDKLRRMAPGRASSNEREAKALKTVYGAEALERVRAVHAEGKLSDPGKYGLSAELLRSLDGDEAQAVDKMFEAMVAASANQRQELTQVLSGEPLYDAAAALAPFFMHMGTDSMGRISPGYAARISVARHEVGADALEAQRDLLGDLYQLVLVAEPPDAEDLVAYEQMMDSLSCVVLPMLTAQHGHLRRGEMVDSKAQARLDLCKGYLDRIARAMSQRAHLEATFARFAAQMAGKGAPVPRTKAAQVEAVEEARMKLEGLQVREAPATPVKPEGVHSLEEVLSADKPVEAQRRSESLWSAAMRADWDPYARLVLLSRTFVPMALRKDLKEPPAPPAHA